MPYINTVERLELERARQEGRQEIEQRALESKRNAAHQPLHALTVDRIATPAQLHHHPPAPPDSNTDGEYGNDDFAIQIMGAATIWSVPPWCLKIG